MKRVLVACLVASFVMATVTVQSVSADPPVGVPGDGLVLALDASTLSGADGSVVTLWPDGSGGDGASGSGSTRPTLVTSGIGGVSTVRFDGDDDFLALGSGFDDFTDGVSMYVVASPSELQHGFMILGLGNGGGQQNLALGRDASNAGLQYFNNRTNGDLGSLITLTGLEAGVPAVYSAVQGGGAVDAVVPASVLRDGVVIGSGEVYVPPVTERGENYIAKSFWANGMFEGDISEVLLYNRTLSATEQTTVTNYLLTKYGIASSAPVSPSALSVTVGDSAVSLGWDAVSGAAGYRVSRSGSAGGPFTQIADIATPDHIDGGLANGTTYHYVVTAYNAVGESAASASISATPGDLDPPVGVPGDGLVLALDASTLSGADGSVVTLWPDGSGGDGASGSGSTRPTLVTSGIGGVSTVRFDGDDDFLALGSGFDDFTDGVSMYVVASPSELQHGFMILGLGNGGGQQNLALGRDASNAGLQYFNNRTNGDLGSLITLTGLEAGVPAVYSAVQGGGAVDAVVPASVLRDGVVIGSGEVYVPPVTERGENYIAKSFWANGMFEGDISEVLLYNRTLSATEQTTVTNYLLTKYGIGSVAPPVPSGLFATSANASVSLSWDAMSSADGYRVSRSTSAGGPFTQIADIATPDHIDGGLANGTTYHYVVTAYNASGESAASTSVPATPLAPPASPSGLTAIAGNASVSLSWDAVTDADGYRVSRSSSAGGPFTQIAEVASPGHVNIGLSNGSTYHYVVSAFNAAGESAASTSASATPLAPPGSPSGLSAIAGNASVSLSWGAVSGADGYRVSRSSSTGGPFTQIVEVASPGQIDDGLTNGSTYHYVVTAYNAAGVSAVSTSVSATPLAPPGTPSGLSAMPANASVSLGWVAVSGADGYRVSRSSSAAGPFTQIVEVVSPGHVDNGLTNGSTFHYVVSAFNAGGVSAASTSVSATPLAPPGSPSGVVATAGDASVSLGWVAVSGADGYRVSRSVSAAGPFTQIVEVVSPGHVDNGLTNGSTFHYVVTAFNAGGVSAASTSVSATPLAPPGSPSGVVATAGDASVSLGWVAVSGADGYRVSRSVSAAGPFTQIVEVVSPGHVDNGLTNGSTFHYVVTAFNAGGVSAASTSVSATPLAPLGLPSGVSGVLSSPVVSPDGGWRAVSEMSSSTLVAVWRSSDGVSWERVAVPANQMGPVAVRDDGSLVVARSYWNGSYWGDANIIDTFVFADGDWFGPVGVASVASGHVAQALVSNGPGLVLVASTGQVFYSSDDAVSWSSRGSVSGGVAVFGNQMYAVGSGGVTRWSFASLQVVGSTSVVLPSDVSLFSAPGSLQNMWLVSLSGGLSVWSSSDAGVSWSVVVTRAMLPFRSGVSFGSPMVGSDGNVHVYGTRVESGSLVLFESEWDTVSHVWLTPTRVVAPVSSGSLMLWRSQRVDGSLVDPVRWVVRGSGSPVTYSVTELAGSGVADPWVTSSQSASGSLVLSGVSGVLSSPVVSPDGGWRAVSEMSSSTLVAVWRSSDGVSWERVAVPANQMGPVAVRDDGSLVVARSYWNGSYWGDANIIDTFVFADGDWFGPVGVASVASGHVAQALVSNGPGLVLVASTGQVFYSSDDAVSWSSRGSVSGGVAVFGNQMYAVGSGGVTRWSFASLQVVGSTSVVLPSDVSLFSAPGSLQNMWLVSLSGGLSVWSSSDAGVSWSVVVTRAMLPFRSGVSFGSPMVGSDGNVHVYGTRVESGSLVLFESEWDTVSHVWLTPTRVVAPVSSGSLMLWRSQRVDGSLVDPVRWVVRGSGSPVTYSVTELAGSGVADPWVTSSQSASGSLVLSGVSGVLSSPVVSPDGGWRAVSEMSSSTLVAVWRSSDGVSWERVAVPANQMGPVAVRDDGSLVVARSYWNGSYWGDANIIDTFVFADGDWFGPVGVASVASGHVAQALVSNGPGLVLVASTGQVFYSSDDAVSWSSRGSVSGGVAVFGNQMYAVGSGGVTRWSFASLQVVGSTSVVLPSDVSLFSAPGSLQNMWLVSLSGGLSVWSSSDAGVSWSVVVTRAMLPFRSGVSFGSPMVGSDGNVHVYGTRVESGSLVLFEAEWDTVSHVWLTPTRVVAPVSSGSLMLWRSQRVDGSLVDPVRWVVRGSGSPVTYSVTELAGSGVADPWVTSSQSASGSLVLSGVSGVLSSPVVSPDGGWRAVSEMSSSTLVAVWRSSDGVSWERVAVPANQMGPVAVRDDGSLVVARSYWNGSYWGDANIIDTFVFADGDWFGPVGVASVASGHVAQALVSNGPGLVLVASTGQVFYSSDDAASWVGSGSVASGSATVVGNVMHVFGGTEYSRWNFTTRSPMRFPPAAAGGPEISVLTGYPGGGRILGSADSPDNLWMSWGGSGLFLIHSSDAGGTWDETATADSELPYGMTSSSFHAALDDRAHFYSTATCTAAQLVYAADHPLGAGAFTPPAPLYLDESKTTTLIGPFTGGNGTVVSSRDAWFTVRDSDGTYDLMRVSGALSSPESVYGWDGYGLTALGVNAAIGNFVSSATDVSVAGVGPSLELTRTYNSSDRRVGLFGRGWTSTFETRVYENCVTKDVTILHGDGRREFHLTDGVGGYVQPAGYTSKLVKTGTTGWTLTETDGTVRTFRTDGRLTSVADADGQRLNLTWNASSQLTKVADQVSARELNFTYLAGRVSSVSTTPVTVGGATAPLVWNYVYSGSNLAKVCDPRNNNPVDGSCVDYTVTGGKITKITDANHNVDKEIGYTAGRVAWEQDGENNRTKFIYTGTSERVIEDPRGHKTTLQFDSQYRLVSVVDALGNETTHEYDAAGFRSVTTDANDHAVTRTFDVNGNVLSEKNALEETTWFAYDAFNNQTAVRDARSSGVTDDTYLVSSTWDGVKRNKTSESTPPTAQQPSGTTRFWEYTSGAEPAVGGGVMPAGLLKLETDARGATTTYAYDSKGDLRRTTDRAGLVVDYGYDQLGRRISETSYPTGFAAGVTATTGFDELGNVVVVDGPAVANAVTGDVHRLRVVNTYDGASNLVLMVESDVGGSANPDPSRTTIYDFDDADRLESVTDPEGGKTEQRFDGVGNVEESIDAAGRHVIATFDERNLPRTKVAQAGVTDEGETTPRNVTVQNYTYDPAGRLETTTDGAGRVVKLEYDDADRVKKRTLTGFDNRAGGTRDIVLEETGYDAAGNPTSVVTGGGRRTETRAYDHAGRMVSSTLDPAGLNRTTIFVYDANGNLTEESLTDGSRTEQTRAGYDAADRLTSSTVENGTTDLTTTAARDNRGVVTAVVDPRGNTVGANPADFRVDYTVDALGRTVRATSPAVTVTEGTTTTTGVRPDVVTGFDTYGQATHRRDERGNVTAHDFDRLGRNTEITHPTYTPATGPAITPTETFIYDHVGNLTRRIDRRGETTIFDFDGLNRVIRQTDPAVGTDPAGITRLFYDDAGNTKTRIDQRGARTEFTYDDLNRLRTQIDVVRNTTATPDRYTTTFDYDDLGNTTYQQTPTLDVTTFEYSPASELLIERDAQLNETEYSYDVASRNTATVDPLERSTVTEYDLAGRPIATRNYSPTDALLTTATATFDAAGNQLSVTTPRGHSAGAVAAEFTTTYSYDRIGRLTEVDQPITATDEIETAYGYDAAGNQTAVADGRVNTTRYGYNEWNLQDEIVEPATTAYPSLSDRTWTTTFDAGGLPVATAEPGGVAVTRVFDDLGRLVNESGTGGGAPGATRGFGYDTTGQTTSADSPNGPITFSYDDRGLLTASNGTPDVTATFVYDANGRMKSRTDAAGTSTFGWTARNQLETVIDGLTNTTRTHNFDAAGQLRTVTNTGGATRTIGYDDLGRITSDELRDTANTPTASYGYGYDTDGHLTTRTVNLPGNSASGTNHHTYDNAGRLTSWTKPDASTVTYGWDDAGNLTNNAGTTATFDERNQILTSGTTITSWTARGTMAATTTPAGTTTSTFDALGRAVNTAGVTNTYDSFDRITTTGTTTFSYAGTEIDPVQVADLRIARTPGTIPVAARQGATTPFLLGRDQHGDIGYHYDPTGTVTATRAYDPLGDVIAETGTLTPLGYQGDYTDPTTGDIWMGARWYQPGTGTFSSRDTIFGQLQTPISLNRYTYALADPLGRWDPDGRCSMTLNPFKAIEECGRKIADALDVGEQSPAALIDEDGPMVVTIEEILANPSPGSSTARLGNAASGFADVAKSMGRGVIAPAVASISGRDVNTMERVSGTERTLATIDLAISMVAPAVRGLSVARAAVNMSDNALDASRAVRHGRHLDTPSTTPIHITDNARVAAHTPNPTHIRTATAAAPFGEIRLAGSPGSLRTVIGKMGDLEAPGAIGSGERTLLDRPLDKGSYRANWRQNDGLLRQEMGRGMPIRDASVNPVTGALATNTGFLAAERNLLRSRNWIYDPKTTMWSPPG